MSMDLWYDLAVRELPAQDERVLAKLKLGDPAEPEEDEGKADTAAPVDGS